jgi:hypothetical protein
MKVIEQPDFRQQQITLQHMFERKYAALVNGDFIPYIVASHRSELLHALACLCSCQCTWMATFTTGSLLF